MTHFQHFLQENKQEWGTEESRGVSGVQKSTDRETTCQSCTQLLVTNPPSHFLSPPILASSARCSQATVGLKGRPIKGRDRFAVYLLPLLLLELSLFPQPLSRAMSISSPHCARRRASLSRWVQHLSRTQRRCGIRALHPDTHLRNLLFVVDSQIIPSGRIGLGRTCAKVTQVYWNVSRIPIRQYPSSCTFSLLTRSFHKSDMCQIK